MPRKLEIIRKNRIIGDINLNWTHYYLETKDNEDLIEEVKEFMLEEGMTQLVENITRRRIVRNHIQESILDHIVDKRKE